MKATMTNTPAAVPTAAEVVHEDLEYICNELAEDFPRLQKKHLLITGGAGFLGYYLVQSVLHYNSKLDAADRCRLTVYDNFIRGVPQWLKDLESTPELSLIEHDIIDPPPADLGHVDFLIHAASIASPMFYREHPIQTMDSNVIGLRHLLELSRAQTDAGTPMEGFLFYSTSEIYGDPTPDQIPTPETYRGNVSCTGPRACYDESKRYGETLCVNFAKQYGLQISIARPFNNYGPGLSINDKRVLPDFANDVFNGRDIVMLSDGQATRTFCYIADAITGYYRVLFRGRAGESYNVGTESPEISMAQLADRVVEVGQEQLGYEGKVVLGESEDPDYLVDNPNRRCPIIRKAREELGYEPKIAVEDGLRRTMAWYAGNRG